MKNNYESDLGFQLTLHGELDALKSAYNRFERARADCKPWLTLYAKLLGRTEKKTKAIEQNLCPKRFFAPEGERRMDLRDAFDVAEFQRLLNAMDAARTKNPAAEACLVALNDGFRRLKVAFEDNSERPDNSPFIDAYYEPLWRYAAAIGKEDAVQKLFSDLVRLAGVIAKYKERGPDAPPMPFRDYLKNAIKNIRVGGPADSEWGGAGPRSPRPSGTAPEGRSWTSPDTKAEQPDDKLQESESREIFRDALKLLRVYNFEYFFLIRSKYFANLKWNAIDYLLGVESERSSADEAKQRWEFRLKKAKKALAGCLVKSYCNYFDTNDPRRAREGIAELLKGFGCVPPSGPDIFGELNKLSDADERDQNPPDVSLEDDLDDGDTLPETSA